jgi:hypothetical protein
MIIKRPQLEVGRTTITRAELREQLIELWAQVFERDLRADLEAEAELSGERARLRAIHNVPLSGIDGASDVADGSSQERARPSRRREARTGAPMSTNTLPSARMEAPRPCRSR